MASPLIFNGRRAKMLTQDGILRADGSIIDNNGAPNLIKNGHAEINATGWTVSKNTVAASRPDSGFVTSGTNITWTRNTTNPIDGQADFLYTKDAADRQGEQAYYGFTVSKKYRAKVLQIEVDYIVNSGTFSAGSSSTDSDIIVYIYDVTNSTFIEPSSFKFLSNSSTIADKFVANFQTSATGSSYRILFHQATTSTSAFAVQFKEIRISPCQYVYGTPISDWISYTPTISNLGTGSSTTNAAKYRRVGDSMETMVTFQKDGSGGSGASVVTWSFPSGLSVDATKLPYGSATAKADSIGSAWVVVGGNYSANTYIPLVNTATTFAISEPTTSTQITGGVIPAGTYIIFRATVPIQGWSSSVQQSDGYDGRVIALKVNSGSTTGTLNTSNNIVKFATTTYKDTTASYSASTGLWTCPKSGWYIISGSYEISHTTASGYIATKIGVDGTIISDDYKYASGVGDSQQSVQSQAIYLTAGQTVGIYSNTNLTTPVFGANQARNWFSVISSANPQTVSATELVSASYNTSASQSISTSTVTIVDFGTKLEDSHGAVTTGGSWKFVAPVAGEYQVNAGVLIAGGNSLPAGNECNLALLKNGVDYKVIAAHYGQTASTASVSLTGAAKVKLNAGEYFDIRVYQTTGSTSTLINQSRFNYVDVFRIK